MSTNDKILDKIRNLLELAEDGGQDEESQTALLMAQKLMLKHKISQNDLGPASLEQIVTRSLSVYKRIYWWEKLLARIIADNFRIMFYLQSHRLPHQKGIQRKIVLMGYQEDVELAHEMFYLAADAMKHHAAQHLAEIKRLSDTTQEAGRKAYYQGFLDGLAERFRLQRAAMAQENEQYALIVQVPKAVQDAFQEQVNGRVVFKQPASQVSTQAYQAGYHTGQKIDLETKRLDY